MQQCSHGRCSILLLSVQQSHTYLNIWHVAVDHLWLMETWNTLFMQPDIRTRRVTVGCQNFGARCMLRLAAHQIPLLRLSQSRLGCCPQETDGFSGGRADDSTPASQVRERYERLLRERQRAEEGGVSAQRVKEQEHAASAAVARTNFKGSISGVFAPYLQ